MSPDDTRATADTHLDHIHDLIDMVLNERTVAYDLLEAAAGALRALAFRLEEGPEDTVTIAAVQGWDMVRKICGVLGHDVADDQCERPEHRLCMRCETVLAHAPLGPGFQPWVSIATSPQGLCDYPGCTKIATANRWDGETSRCPDHVTIDGS